MSAGAAADLFRRAHGRDPQVVASAPGRVNLIGEHTDYNGGEVLPIAIDRRTWVALGQTTGSASSAVSRDADGVGTFSVDDASPAGQWWDYLHGALREVHSHLGGERAWAAAVVSDVPAAAGLSSSAALEVATVVAAAHLVAPGQNVPFEQVATWAHRAEREFVGVACGIMDQWASAGATSGHALRIWCDDGRSERVPFDRDVLVIDTAVPRALRHSAFNARQASCVRALQKLRRVRPGLADLAHASLADVERALDGADLRRARHVVTETARVAQFVEALSRGEPLGELLVASHRSLRDDYECSSPELDWVVDRAMNLPGVDGARLTGAGWGGCAIAVGEPMALDALAAAIAREYSARWGHAARTWRTRASDGAMIDA